MELTNQHNAASLFFYQANRPELAHRPRLWLPDAAGAYQPLTWTQLAERVANLAAFLIERGVGHGTQVAVMGNTRLEWCLGALGLLAARGTLVPVYPTIPPDQIAHVVGHSESRVLLVENTEMLTRALRTFDRVRLDTIVTMESCDVGAACRAAGVDPERIAPMTHTLAAAEQRGARLLADDARLVSRRLETITLQDVAFLVYTSGTTGLPKGVPLTHLNVGASGTDWILSNGELVREGDVDTLWLPMSHLYGMGQFFLGNQFAFESYLTDPLKVMAVMAQVKPHVFMSVPLYWEKIMQAATFGGADQATQAARLAAMTGGRLRFCLSGGAGLARSVKEFFKGHGIMIIEGYGLTECSPNLTMNRIDDYDFDSVGKPVPGVTLKLADDGEILAKGPNVFAGYFKDPAATRAVFDADGWFCTGDLASVNAQGFYKIIGRKKEILVTSGGKNVAPANIELCFKDFPLISNLVVYGEGKKYLTALVDINDEVAKAQLAAAGAPTDGDLRAHPQVHAWVEARIAQVNETLAKYETVKRFVIAPTPLTLEGGLLTPTLKVKRQKVYDQFRTQLEALYD